MSSRPEHMVRVLFFTWLGMIAAFSLMPGGAAVGNMPVVISASGYWEHLAAYGVLGALGWLGFSGKYGRTGMLTGAFLLSAVFEVLQLGILGRSFNPLDISANGLGLITGLALAWLTCGGKPGPRAG